MDDDDPETLHDGRYLELRRRGGWEFAHRRIGRSVVAVIAVDREDRLLLVEQFRPAVEAHVIELPAGLVGDGIDDANENALAAARRELMEETGFEAESWIPLPSVVSSAGLTDERVELFLARGLHRVGPGGGIESEAITVHLVPLSNLIPWLGRKIDGGCSVDGRVYAAPTFISVFPE
ncbi:MAG: NUDIX hydrolase [Phycisphaera sp.]|nr:NUDIX hydrolase [Phycisphaera sp.]